MDRGREEGEYANYANKREDENMTARGERETKNYRGGGFAQRTASEKPAKTLNGCCFALVNSELSFTFNGRASSLLTEGRTLRGGAYLRPRSELPHSFSCLSAAGARTAALG